MNGWIVSIRIEVMLGHCLKNMGLTKTDTTVNDKGIESGGSGIVGDSLCGRICELIGMSDNERVEIEARVDGKLIEENMTVHITWHRNAVLGILDRGFFNLLRFVGDFTDGEADNDIMAQHSGADGLNEGKIMFFEPAGKIWPRHRNDKGLFVKIIERKRPEPSVEALDINAFFDSFEDTIPSNVFFNRVHIFV